MDATRKEALQSHKLNDQVFVVRFLFFIDQSECS